MKDFKKICQDENIEECVENIIRKHNIRMKEEKDTFKEFVHFTISLYHNNKKIGHMKYDIDKDNKAFFIDCVEINDFPNKKQLPFKLFRFLLLKEICQWSHYVKNVYLNASSTCENKNSDFCLYQKMGFEIDKSKLEDKESIIVGRNRLKSLPMIVDPDVIFNNLQQDINFIKDNC